MKLRILLAGIVCTVSIVAEAASVQEVDAKKKTVTVELGEDETMEKGDEVCFFTAKSRKVDCGAVTKVKGTAVTVKMKSAKKLKSIKPDMLAKVGSEPPGEETGEKKEKGAKGNAKTGKKAPLRLWGLAVPSVATPAVYKKISYAAPAVGVTTPETLWSQDGDVKSALVGIGGGVGIPLGTKSLNLGVRMRTFTPSIIDSDYVAGAENPYVSTEQKATAIGLWVDYSVIRTGLTQSLFFDLATGLDIDMSTVTVKVIKKDDTPGAPTSTLASASSKLNVISLRVGAAFEMMLVSVIGGRFGLDLGVPLYSAGTFSGSVDETETKKPPEPAADLEKALGHKKGGVGIGLNFGLFLAF